MKIQDYLHLYLGCEIRRDGHSRNGVLKADSLQYITEHELFEEIKPILRPLSDMTSEETKEWWSIRMVHHSDNNKHNLIIRGSKSTSFLLSKHFDIFGLIEAGLAIDKTKEVAA